MTTTTTRQLHHARRLLCALQDHIRDTLLAARRKRSASSFTKIAAVTAADTIYEIDRISEAAILAWFDAHWPRAWPVELVMEGLEDSEAATFPRGTPVAKTLFKCILDPIDGTRGLMYDKRSAWILAALAPQRGPKNHLGDLVVAAMTELPTSKQWRADQLSGVRGEGRVRAEAINVLDGSRQRFAARPSRARDFQHGFASLARFFPEGKALTAQIEEALWQGLYGHNANRSPLIFDDQYIASGGQIYELLVGHDRMLGDLRPLVFAKLGLRTALACHPYDLCTAFLLAEAGGVVEAPDGKPLRAPLDTTSSVAWMGYANPHLARAVRPVLKRLIAKFL
ncbi:MAG: inositol monophosphatase [Verrucomicrobia bacterium]|nr:inositol monophosphatase [Verrucomicrobiota bacterium]